MVKKMKIKKENNLHTFVICAYKEQQYLEECIKSLQNQTLKSKIIISTSTPNEFIKGVSKKCNVELRVNTKSSGLINDFCFAYEQANTKYVTLCKQDDVYFPKFAEIMVNKMEKSENVLIAFSNYNELRNNKIVKYNNLLLIKRIINFPLLLFKKSKKIRLFTLSIGNAIYASSVTYNKHKVSKPIIQSNMKSNVDWITWIDLAKKDGAFLYINKALLCHRIHEGSTSTNLIQKNYTISEKNNSFKEKHGRKKMKYLLVILYLILTVAGLILYKYGSNKNFVFEIQNGVFNLKLNVISILGLFCYLLSFLIYIIVLPRFDLSYIIPLTSAVSYISIFTLSILVLKESVTVYGIIGSIIILIGIIILNFGGK